MFDVLVIGGGINGTGCVRDAAGRGLKVALCEKDDLASHTSSKSTKLIHGGLRYLENYEFVMVRDSLVERERLLKSAPHIIWPLRFVLPHHDGLRSRWLIRLGLFFYDHLGGRKRLGKSNPIKFESHPAGKQLKKIYRTGYEYSDCWVQDSRLVVLNAKDAADKGAEIMTRTLCHNIVAEDDHWKATLFDRNSQQDRVIQTRSIINAAGPWVQTVMELDGQQSNQHQVRHVKGSHVIFNKLVDHDYPYIFQNTDGRVNFVIPYEKNYTLVGTTDVDFMGDLDNVEINDEEIDYLCNVVNDYLNIPVRKEDVISTYAGVRPLYDDANASVSKITRDYYLHVSTEGPPLISIFGGKITSYRKLSEDVCTQLMTQLGTDLEPWTAQSILPGGDIIDGDYDRFVRDCSLQYPWLEDEVIYDYTRNYGTSIHNVLQNRDSIQALGEYFGDGLYEAEVQYLIDYEWAKTAEDILWRRTKKGLTLSPRSVHKLEDWLTEHVV